MLDAQGHSPMVGVWDTVCTFGRYQHQTVDGDPCITVHDASTCKAMLDDFAAHPESDIFYDKQHEVVEALGDKASDDSALREWAQGDGHAMAWANAMVMIVGGQVARYEAHPGAPQEPPSADEVLRQSDGSMRPDGVYGRRSMVTPRGADPASGIAAFRFTSPFFVPEKDGHRLLNLTLTNDPRMRDCALAFSRSAPIAMQRIAMTKQEPITSKPSMENRMDPKEMARMMEAAGCKAEDKDDEKLSKMTAYARKMEEASAETARKMQDPAFSGKETPSEEGAEHDALVKRIQALEEKNAMLLKELDARSAVSTEMQQAMERFRKMEAEQKRTAAVDFARQAISMGRIRGTHVENDETKTVEWLAGKYEKDAATAQEFLSPEGTFKPSEAQMMQRLTVKGAGIGAPQPVVPAAGVSPLHTAQQEFSAAVGVVMQRRRKEGSKLPDDQALDEAERIVTKEQPELARRAQGQGA